MAQMYKVFTEKGIFIFTDLSENTQNLTLNIREFKVEKWNESADYEMLEEGIHLKNIYECQQPEKAMLSFFKTHLIWHAAGGLVYNQSHQFLVIFRNGVWDLPKGKMEAGETKEETAVREVEEECGISGVQLIRPLLTTYHTYPHKKESILKPSHWYLMKYDKNEPLIPQTEEGITEVKWVDEKELLSLKEKTYPSIADVIDCYFEN